MSTDLALAIPPKIIEACTWIARGKSVRDSCLEAHMSDRDFWVALSENTEIEAAYIRARESRSHTRFEDMLAMVAEVKEGKLEPNAGRVVLDAVKWIMGKEKGRVYGDATILRGDKDNPIEIGLATSLQALDARRVVALIDKPVIDLEPTDARLNAKDFI